MVRSLRNCCWWTLPSNRFNEPAILVNTLTAWVSWPGHCTFRLAAPIGKVGHVAEPEATVRVSSAIVASEALVRFREFSEHLIFASLPVEHSNAALDADENALTRIDPGNVARHPDRDVKLYSLNRGSVVCFQRRPVNALVLDVDEAYRFGLLFIKRPLSKAAASREPRPVNFPFLETCHRPGFKLVKAWGEMRSRQSRISGRRAVWLRICGAKLLC